MEQVFECNSMGSMQVWQQKHSYKREIWLMIYKDNRGDAYCKNHVKRQKASQDKSHKSDEG